MKCYKNIIVIICFFVFAAIGGKAWAAEQTVIWTATEGALGTGIGSGTISTESYVWNYTRTLISGTSYTGWNTNCIQLGSSSGVENITITTSAIPGTIKSVSVECSSYNNQHKVSISVGGTTYLASTATPKWTTVAAKSGTGTSSGEIVISFTDGTRALYIKSITVVYDNCGTEDFSGYAAASYNAGSYAQPINWTCSTTGSYAPRVASNTSLTTTYDIDGMAGQGNFLYMVGSYSGDKNYSIMPLYSLSSLSFKYAYESTSYGTLEIGYVTDPSSPSTTYTRLRVLEKTTTLTTVTLTGSEILAINSANRYVTFFWNCSSVYGVGIDDVEVCEGSLATYDYTINYNANGGIGTMSQQTCNGSTVTLTPNAFTYTDKIFYGWNTAADGSGVDYLDEQTIVLTGNLNLTLYAQWRESSACPSVTFSDLGYADATTVSSVVISTSPSITMTFSEGTHAGVSPKYYDNGSAIRVYGGNTFTVSITGSVPITSIVFDFASGEDNNAISVNTGSYNSGIWVGSASSVTFTVAGNAGHRRLASMEVCSNICRNNNFTLEYSSTTIAPNTNLDLVVTSNNSNGIMRWSSSNTNVATVDVDGHIHAVDEGHCVITAIVAGDGTNCGGMATCNINISCDDCARVGWGSKSNQSENSDIGGVYFYRGGDNKYSYTQQIYTAEEIRMAGGRAGVIDSIKVHHNGGTVITKSDVFLGLTTRSDFQDDWVNYGLVQVANNQTLNYGNGWTKIDTHSAGFEWDGTSNVVVAFRNHIESGNNGYCLNGDDRGNDKYNYCISSSSIALTAEHVPSSFFGTTRAHRTNLKFCINPCSNPMDAYFAEDEITIRLGGGAIPTTLTTNPSEGVTVTYTSTDPSIVTINSSGVITPVSEGSAIIIAHVTKSGYCTANAYLSVNVCNCNSGEEPYQIGNEQDLSSIYGPVCNVNESGNDGRYSYRQIIYRSGELQSGTIKSIAFEYASATAMTKKTNVKIYMAMADKAEFTSRTDWVAHSEFTEVYSGNLNCNIYGWNKFNLTTPFVYDGCRNLVVAIYDNSNKIDGSLVNRFKYSNSEDNVQLFNNGAVPSGDGFPGLGGGSFYASEDGITSYFPNTKFCIQPSSSGVTHTLSYDVTGNCTGAGATVSSPEIPSVIASETTITNIMPHCSKYASFHAWNTEVDGSGIYYYPGDNIKLCTDITLHAIYHNRIHGESSCENAVAFCNSDNSISFHVEEAPGELYGNFCDFFSTPSTWWYMQIAEPGDLYMTIESSVGDVDMACWGPFDNVTCDLSDLSDEGSLGWDYYNGETYHYSTHPSVTPTHTTSTPICGTYTLTRPSGNLVDFGGSTSSKEYLQIINAQRGEYYMVIVANYANRAGEITFTQTGGAGRASCDIVNDCDITSISAITECTSSNSYKVSGEVSFRDAPVDVNATLTITLGGTTRTFSPPFASPIAYEFTGLTPNGTSQNITATFTSSTINCSKISTYTAPSKSFCEEIILPVTLVRLRGECNGKRALISWTTASERNNDYFVVERSDDAMNFVEVGRVAGAGNSIEMLSYNYADYSIRTGENYYRLTQVDYDGTRTTSEIIEVHCSGNAPEGDPDVYVYPNPFNSDLTVHLVNFGDKPARIAVYDMLGRQLFERTAYPTFNDSEIVLQLGGLPDAAYTVRVSTSEFVVNRKVVKNK